MSLPQEIRQLWESYLGRGVLGQMITNPYGTLPLAAAPFDIFIVNTGNVLITLLYGMCTADEANACTAQWQVDATVGGISYLSAATDIVGVNTGDIITAQGDPALPSTPAADSGAGPAIWHPWIAKPGSIGLDLGAADAVSDWIFNLCYVPLDVGAYVSLAP